MFLMCSSVLLSFSSVVVTFLIFGVIFQNVLELAFGRIVVHY